jgi:hypothetical protein
MHNSRLNVLFTSSRGPLDHYNKWSVLALNLLGDPEMEVRTSKPRFIRPDVVFEYEKLYIKVFEEGFVHNQVKQFSAMAVAGEQSHILKPDKDGKIPFEKEWLANENFQLIVNVNDVIPYTIPGTEIKSKLERSKASEQEPKLIEADEFQTTASFEEVTEKGVVAEVLEMLKAHN